MERTDVKTHFTACVRLAHAQAAFGEAQIGDLVHGVEAGEGAHLVAHHVAPDDAGVHVLVGGVDGTEDLAGADAVAVCGNRALEKGKLDELSLPTAPPIVPELAGAAMIREVHVYGQSLEIGDSAQGAAQHLGLGTQLIERAAEIAREKGYPRLAVISAIGTREYYRKRDFADADLYQIRAL